MNKKLYNEINSAKLEIDISCVYCVVFVVAPCELLFLHSFYFYLVLNALNACATVLNV